MSGSSLAPTATCRRFDDHDELFEAGDGFRPPPAFELRQTRANGQPAFGCYLQSRTWGMIALTLSGEQIAEITFFSDPIPGGPVRPAAPDLNEEGSAPI